MKRLFYMLALPALTFVLGTPAKAGTLTLTGASAFNANADGSSNGGGVTATGNCCQRIFVELDTFTGSSIDYLGSGGISLTAGNHTIYLESSDWTGGFGVANGGINLFFDDLVIPGISIHLATSGDKDVPTPWTVTAAGVNTLNLSNGGVASSASSLYDNGVASVSLNASTVNWVGGTGSNPYASNLTVQRLDVTVTADGATATPEPASALLLAPGLFYLVYRRRAARQSAS